MILAIKTNVPLAELTVLDMAGKGSASLQWQADRELSNTIFYKLDEVLRKAAIGFKNLKGIIVFEGPGSFTGLRIGITLSNSLAYALDIPVAGAGEDDWQKKALVRLKQEPDKRIVVPVYGGEANITKPKK